MGMRQTPVVSRSMAGSPRERAAPHRMLSAAEVGGLLTGCSGPPGFESCLFRSPYSYAGEQQTVKVGWWSFECRLFRQSSWQQDALPCSTLFS